MSLQPSVVRTVLALLLLLLCLQPSAALPAAQAAPQAAPQAGSPYGIRRVSLASGGAQSQGADGGFAVSADGRYVAFRSGANDLVAGDTNDAWDIFWRDTQTNQTRRVSVSSAGAQAPLNHSSDEPAISADGRYVAFSSHAPNLVAGDTNETNDVFLHDTQTGQTRRISLSSGDQPGSAWSEQPFISADGRYVAFESPAPLTGDLNEAYDVFFHDTQTGQTQRVSTVFEGDPAEENYDAHLLGISPDGRYVFYSSRLDTGAEVLSGIFRSEVQSLANTRILDRSIANEISSSHDGRYIAFDSDDSSQVVGDSNGFTDVFVRDLQTNQTRRVSLSSDGQQADSASYSASISADGRYVTFVSDATNLVAGDSNNQADVFLHDTHTGVTRRVNTLPGGVQANSSSGLSRISADGARVFFSSYASNLVDDDTNSNSDIFQAPQNRWTILHYIAGDNNLAPTYPAVFQHLESMAGHPGLRILVFWDGSQANDTAYYEIQFDNDPNVSANYVEGVNKWSQGELNSGNPVTLANFIAWGVNYSPSLHYSLALDDHGSGLGGLAYDDVSSDHITLPEWRSAMQNAQTATGRKIDVLYMAMCLMGMIEDAYQVRDLADYYIANQDLQTTYVNYLAGFDPGVGPAAAAEALARAYANEMVANGTEFTISVADLGQLQPLVDATNSLGAALNTRMEIISGTLVNTAFMVQRFDNEDPAASLTISDTAVDLYDFVELLGVNAPAGEIPIIEAAAAVKQAVGNYILYEQHANGGGKNFVSAHGVSIFFPGTASSFYNDQNYDFAAGAVWSLPAEPDVHTATAADTWGAFLVNYFQTTQPGGPDDPTPPELRTKPQPGQPPALRRLYLPLARR